VIHNVFDNPSSVIFRQNNSQMTSTAAIQIGELQFTNFSQMTQIGIGEQL
jgi:hypothetical protein